MPGNLLLDLRAFDATTTILKLRIRMPEPAAANQESAAQTVKLSTEDGQHVIQIPIRYRAAE